MQFTSFEEIKKFINYDVKSNDISCVRYINIETMDMWIKLKAYLTNICSDFIKLSDFCEEEDTTPNISRLKSKLKKAGKNTLVTPLSEHLRVNNSLTNKTLEEILKLEYKNNINNNLKIYIPIYRMKSILRNLTSDRRFQKSILFLETESDCDYSLMIVQDTLKVKIAGNEIKGYKKYLTYWEQNPDKPIILHTQNAIHYADIVFADDVKVIISPFDVIKHQYTLNDTIKREWGTDSQWMQLSLYLNDFNNLELALMNILSAPKFDIKIFDNWTTRNDFEKWGSWLWAKKSILSGYLKITIENSKTVNDLENKIFNSVISIIDRSNYKELYFERKSLIEKMGLKATNNFWDCIKNLDGLDKLKCLTDITDKEKSNMFDILQDTDIDEKAQQVLSIVYPDLFFYLSSFSLGSVQFDTYFEQYKLQKVKNKSFDYFTEKVEKIAKEQSWWHLNARNVLVNQTYNENNNIIFYVDALGVEYLKLLIEKIERNKVICDVEIGYCNIPSTTAKNNDFLINKKSEKTYELDELKHKNINYPDNIIRELEIINKIADAAVALLEDYDKVIIATDHGSSRLAVLAKGDTIRASESADIYKYGRYCIDNTRDYSVYETCIEKNGCWTWGDYSRFASQGAPVCETHGGALLEEILVPIISIKKSNIETRSEHLNVVIILLTKEIKLTADRKIKVQFKLSKELKDVFAVVNNNRHKCTYSNGIYSFEPNVNRNDNYTAKIVSGEIIGSIKYKVIKGISSNFDI